MGSNGTTDSDATIDTVKERDKGDSRSASAETRVQSAQSGMTSNVLPIPEHNGFERGFEAEKILGATDANGELFFLLKFKEADQAEMVPATVANVKIPHMVIKFYEERLSWYSDSEE